MAERPPRVSVVLPTYCRSRRIIPTIESVLAQTFRDWEMVVVDDGSPDDTGEVVQELARSEPRIRYHRQPNGGGAAARATGMALARGEYVAFLDHDDRWTPDKLALQVEHLDRHPEDGMVYGRVDFIDEDGNPKGTLKVRYRSGSIRNELVVSQNLLGTYTNPMIRANLLRESGGPDPSVGMSDDWDLFIRLADKAPVGFIDRTLVLYNIGNEASQTRDMTGAIEAEKRVLEKHRALVERLDPVSRFRLAWNMRHRRAGMLRITAHRAQANGELRQAAMWYRRAAALDFTVLLPPYVLMDLASLTKRLALGRSPEVSQ
jgi:glycosyltransferase involved in cell wall biosynthesis